MKKNYVLRSSLVLIWGIRIETYGSNVYRFLYVSICVNISLDSGTMIANAFIIEKTHYTWVVCDVYLEIRPCVTFGIAEWLSCWSNLIAKVLGSNPAVISSEPAILIPVRTLWRKNVSRWLPWLKRSFNRQSVGVKSLLVDTLPIFINAMWSGHCSQKLP